MRALWRLCACILTAFYILTPLAAFAQSTSAPAAPMPTCEMSVTPGVISVGGAVTLAWQSQNAYAGSISGVGAVGLSGSIQLLPSSASATTFQGTFVGAGGTANCEATVQVTLSSGSSGTTGSSNSVGQPLNLVPTVTTPTPTPANTSSFVNPCSGGAGLVPCGCSDNLGVNSSGSPSADTNANGCQACDLAALVQNLINFLIGVAIPIAAALFAYAGILFYTSGANPGNIAKARGIFKNALIGFLIAISAWLVVNTFLHILVQNAQYTQGGFFTIQCSQNRQTNGSVNNLINSVLPGVNTTGGLATNGVSQGGTQGNTVVGSTVTQADNDVLQDALNDACEDDGDQASCSASNSATPKLTDAAQDILEEDCDDGNQASCTAETDSLNSVASAPLNGQCTGDLSAGSLASSAAAGGYALSSNQAAGLSCIAQYESSCGNNTSGATTPTGQATSASGPLQIVFGQGKNSNGTVNSDDIGHNLNISTCTTAAQAAGFDVSGNLNCSSAFSGGKPLSSNLNLANACIAAANSVSCYAPAAAALAQSAGGLSPWTADSRSSGQAQCIANNQ